MKKFFLSPITYHLLPVFSFLTLCSLLFAMFGCATLPKEEYVFPAPHIAQPRLKYLYDITNEKDLYPKKRLPFLPMVWRFLVGRETQDYVLLQPWFVAADEKRVYVTDVSQEGLIVFDYPTRKIYRWGTSGAGRLSKPAGIALDKGGRVYVADQLQLVIKVYDAQGNFLYQFGKPGAGEGEFSGPQGIALDKEQGLLYVLDRGNNRISVFDLFGNYLFTIGSKDFTWAQYIAVDKEGKVYITDSLLCVYVVYERTGKLLKVIGGAGDITGYFGRPKGIAVDSDGNIYVADAHFNIVQIFNSEGKVNFFFGGVPPYLFSLPQGLYIDEQDRLYVVDTLHQRIQVYQYLK